MATNYDDVIQQLESAGLLIDHLVIGKMRRCKVEGSREKKGWYAVHEITLDGGDAVLVGSYGVWQGADNNAQKIKLNTKPLSAEQKAAIRARLAEDRKRADNAQRAEHARAAARAEKVWRKCATSGESDYFARKGISAHGVRFTPQGSVVIPMMDVGMRVHGLQFILSRQNHKARIARTGTDKEFWPKGLNLKGHFHLMGVPAWVLIVAEGYATAASLHEATGLPVAVAFTANNIVPVAQALAKRYKHCKILIAADDDRLQRCLECKAPVQLTEHPTDCPNCGKPHKAENGGIKYASMAALAVGGQWIAPVFEDEAGIWAKFQKTGAKTTDFNDLHALEGAVMVRSQVDDAIQRFGWAPAGSRAAAAPPARGEGKSELLRPIDTLDELIERYSLIYGEKEAVFDHAENIIVSISDMRNICISRELHRRWMEHPEKSIVRMSNVGFDPTEKDPKITCNTYAGWPTTPKAGSCEMLLELLGYLCSAEDDADGVYRWLIKWLAYPIQHPGAKMQSAIVMHGGQGTGKSKFFKSYGAIFGRYALTINQSAVESPRNVWLAGRLFILAEEVVARQELFHVKNALKDLVTNETVYVDPKFVNPYEERNHVNLVFLSNETMPIVLEDDDRRHLVVNTPDTPQPMEFYRDVQAEIDAGGIAALHDYLLNIDLTGFNAHSKPPLTQSKRVLQDLALDSPTRFFRDLTAGQIDGISTGVVGLSTDVFELYRAWCARINVKPAPQPKFLNALEKKHKVRTERKRYTDVKSSSLETKGPHGMCYLPSEIITAQNHTQLKTPECPAGTDEKKWLGQQVSAFRNAVKDYKGETRV